MAISRNLNMGIPAFRFYIGAITLIIILTFWKFQKNAVRVKKGWARFRKSICSKFNPIPVEQC
jgi:hypothetical protein